MPTPTDAQLNGKTLAGATLTPADGGKVLTFPGATRPIVAYVRNDAIVPSVPVVNTLIDGNKLPALVVGDKWAIKFRQQGDTDYSELHFKVAAAAPAATPPPIVTTSPASQPDDTSAPVPPVAAPTPVVFLGVCGDYGDAPADAPKYAAVGVGAIRCFGPGIRTTFDSLDDNLASIRKMHAAVPGMIYIDQRGVPQQDDSKGQRATPLTEDQRKAWWAVYAKATADMGDWLIVEGNNEVNLSTYLDFGQRPDQVDARVVAYVVAEVKIMRAALGPARRIIAPTIGYTDGAAPHNLYVKAFRDAGVYDDPNVIVGDHVYSRTGVKQVQDQLGGNRQIIGPIKPMVITECGVQYQALPDGPANATLYVGAVRSANASLCWYRGKPGSKPRTSDTVSVLKADGTPNHAMVNALGPAVLA